MPRIIVKCKYYKNAASGNLGGLMKYIATREGVEKLPKEQRALPATDNQQQFITQIVSRNNAIRTTPEYKAFMKAKTRGNALYSRIRSIPSQTKETEKSLTPARRYWNRKSSRSTQPDHAALAKS